MSALDRLATAGWNMFGDRPVTALEIWHAAHGEGLDAVQLLNAIRWADPAIADADELHGWLICAVRPGALRARVVSATGGTVSPCRWRFVQPDGWFGRRAST